MLDAVRKWLGRGKADLVDTSGAIEAATQLPPVAVPKVKNKQQSIPSYITNTRSRDDRVLPRADRNLANTDILTYRSAQDTRQVVRDMVRASPDLSSAVFAYLRTAISAQYTAVARNMDGTFNRDATLLLQQVLTRFDTVQNYEDGFSGIWSIRAISESLGKELMQYGACSAELVLDKARLPRTLAPISVMQVQFKQDDKWLKPIQKIGQEEIDLDIPTYFYLSLDQDLLEPYAGSPLEAALQPVIADADFFNDLRRLVKRVLHPRLDVKINEEKFRATIPQEVGLDAEKTRAYTAGVFKTVEQTINDLGPEDALVHFDFIEVDYLNHGTNSPAGEEQVLQDLARSRLAAGAKTLPSILGHGDGTSNAASTESMLFVKSVAGTIQLKLNEFFSRALTLSLRLFGQDVYVEFVFEPINLRPEAELEAFKSMRQDRVLGLLSLGFYGDDEAAIILTGKPTPAGFKPLSGTNFHQAGGIAGNPYTNTGAQGNKQGPLNQSLDSDAPKNKKNDKGK